MNQKREIQQNDESENTVSGPVGSGEHVVQQGECLESIACESGLFWETIWNASENVELKRVRKNPNTLLPGDRIFIPAIRVKEESCSTGNRHSFVQKGAASILHLVLQDIEGKPRANLRYVLDIDGLLTSGQSNDEGEIRQRIPANAGIGKLIIIEGEEEEEYQLFLGHLDPVTEISGMQARMNNLGFDCGEVDGVLGPKTQKALRAFQLSHNLRETEDPDAATRDMLLREHEI